MFDKIEQVEELVLKLHDEYNNQLSFDDLFYLWVLYFDNQESENIRTLVALYRYNNIAQIEKKKENSRVSKLSRDRINALYKLGLINNQWKLKDDFPDDIQLTTEGISLFERLFTLDKNYRNEELCEQTRLEQLGEEFFKEYPASMSIKGINTSLKTCNPFTFRGRTFSGKQETISIYLKIIKTQETHDLVMEKLRWAKQQNGLFNDNSVVPAIQQKITSFVINEAWNDINMENGNEFITSL